MTDNQKAKFIPSADDALQLRMMLKRHITSELTRTRVKCAVLAALDTLHAANRKVSRNETGTLIVEVVMAALMPETSPDGTDDGEEVPKKEEMAA